MTDLTEIADLNDIVLVHVQEMRFRVYILQKCRYFSRLFDKAHY